MADNLSLIEHWLDPLIENLSQSQRRKFFRKIGVSLRKRQVDRIKAQKNPDGSGFAPRKKTTQKKSGSIRRRKDMFLKLRQARHLKISANAKGVAVGYSGKAAMIAKIHQYGLLSRVMQKGPLYQYPVRKLLGFSREDTDWLLDEIKEHLIK